MTRDAVLAVLALLLAMGAARAEISFRAASTSQGEAGGVQYVAQREQSGGAGSVTLTIPDAAEAGDLLLATVAAEGIAAADFTAPAGWTEIRGDTAGDHAQVTYWRFATAGDVSGSASWSWSWTGTRDYSASITAFRGVNPANPVDTHAGTATNSSNQTTIDIPAITPSVAQTLLVAAVSIRSGSTFGGWSGGLAERADDRSGNGGDEVGHGVASVNGPAAGVSSGTYTVTASNNDTSRIGQLIALVPSGASIAMPEGTGEGDLMIVTVAVESQAHTDLALTGFTKIRGDDAGDHALATYYRFATAADVAAAGTTWAVTWGASTRDYSASLLVFRGVDAADPISAHQGTVGAGGNSITIDLPAITPDVAGTHLVAIGSIRSGSTFSGWSGSLAERTDARSAAGGNEVGLGTATAAGPAAGVSSGAFTVTGSDNDQSRIGHTLALRPGAVPGPVLRWRMDEAAWPGGATDVFDASGNNLHGTGFFAAAPTAVNARFCRSGSFNGINQYVQTAGDPLLDITDRLTVSAWVRPGAYGGELKSIVSKDTNYELHLTAAGSINWYWVGAGGARQITTAGTVPLNAWTHIVVVHTRGAQEIYINGVRDTHNWADPERTLLATNANPFQVGQDQGYGSRWFEGLIDEVRVYNYAMSAADVATLYNDVPSPACALSHFTVVPSGGASASTCLAKGFLISARDGNGNLYTGYGGTINLTTSTSRGDWANGDGGNAVSGGGGNDGAAAYPFAGGDGGDVTLNLTNQSQDDLVVAVADSTQPWVSGVSGTVNFRDNVFLISEDLSGLVAGAGVAVAGRPHDLRATYVYKDNVTANCGTLASYAGSKSLKAWIARDGSDPGGASPQVGATALPNAAPGGNNLTLNFAAGVANFNLSTTDVGKYALQLRDEAPGVANTVVSGNSATLTVRPFTIAVSAIAQGAIPNPAEDGDAGSVFAAAGSSFGMTLGAYLHSPAADANNDGVPDASASFAQTAAAGLAPSFAATATFSAVAPFTPAAGGILNNGSIAMSAGAASPTNLNFTEAGSFTLSTADAVTSYLGTAGVNLSATVFDASGAQVTAAPVVGRFRPDHFALAGAATLAHRANAACAPASGFSYLGEALRLDFSLQARNALGAVTQNYHGAWAKLGLNSFAAFDLGARAGSTPLSARLDDGLAPVGSWSSGVATVSLTTTVHRAAPDAPDGPFAVQFGIAPTDSDGVAMAAPDLDADVNGSAERKDLGVAAEMRFGRLRLQNVAGSEHIGLQVPAQLQYWNGSGFVLNGDDSCTALAQGNIALDFSGGAPLAACDTAVPAAPIVFSAGMASIALAPPGAGNVGSVLLTPQLGSTASGNYCAAVGGAYTPASPALRSYLLGRYNDGTDPDGDVATGYDDNPSARVGFGVYGARPRNFIFFREIY